MEITGASRMDKDVVSNSRPLMEFVPRPGAIGAERAPGPERIQLIHNPALLARLGQFGKVVSDQLI